MNVMTVRVREMRIVMDAVLREMDDGRVRMREQEPKR